MKKSGGKDFIIFAVCMIVGMLLGKIISQNWNTVVEKEVEEALNRVVMIEVPQIDREIGDYLANNKYEFDYITAIDISDGTYGIYEVEHKTNSVQAYAHGKCSSVGKARPGIYKIVETKEHLDYHDARYWRVVYLNRESDNQKLIVSSSAYEIDDIPRIKITGENADDLGNVMIDGEVMLTVYENSVPGIVLVIIDGDADED